MPSGRTCGSSLRPCITLLMAEVLVCHEMEVNEVALGHCMAEGRNS